MRPGIYESEESKKAKGDIDHGVIHVHFEDGLEDDSLPQNATNAALWRAFENMDGHTLRWGEAEYNVTGTEYLNPPEHPVVNKTPEENQAMNIHYSRYAP